MSIQSPFPFSHTNKRYHTYDHYLRERFSAKCFKVPLDGGFTCPNRDGTKGFGGCTYCSAKGSGDFTAGPQRPVREQFRIRRDALLQKWPASKYIAYFQAYTNTYAPLQRLRMLFEEALAQEGVVGLSISTRPDCLPDDVIDYLHTLSRRTFLTVELGLQTVHDQTAKRINRCHSYEDFLYGYQRLAGINRCVHIINGLPGENYDMMLETARCVASLRPDFVKIHLLHVLRGTALAQEYLDGGFEAMTLENYVRIVCDQIERFPAQTVIERVTGDGAKEELIAPLWSLKKFVVMNEIDKELRRRDSYQSIHFQ